MVYLLYSSSIDALEMATSVCIKYEKTSRNKYFVLQRYVTKIHVSRNLNFDKDKISLINHSISSPLLSIKRSSNPFFMGPFNFFYIVVW